MNTTMMISISIIGVLSIVCEIVLSIVCDRVRSSVTFAVDRMLDSKNLRPVLQWSGWC